MIINIMQIEKYLAAKCFENALQAIVKTKADKENRKIFLLKKNNAGRAIRMATAYGICMHLIQ